MVLKTLQKEDKKGLEAHDLEGYEFVDHISAVKIKDGYLKGKWDNKDGNWEDPIPLSAYAKVYLLNDSGQTLEKLV